MHASNWVRSPVTPTGLALEILRVMQELDPDISVVNHYHRTFRIGSCSEFGGEGKCFVSSNIRQYYVLFLRSDRLLSFQPNIITCKCDLPCLFHDCPKHERIQTQIIPRHSKMSIEEFIKDWTERKKVLAQLSSRVGNCGQFHTSCTEQPISAFECEVLAKASSWCRGYLFPSNCE